MCHICLYNWEQYRETAKENGDLVLKGEVNEEICAICSDSPEEDMIMCSSCPRTYCNPCLRRVLNTEELEEMNTSVDWKCMCCFLQSDAPELLDTEKFKITDLHSDESEHIIPSCLQQEKKTAKNVETVELLRKAEKVVVLKKRSKERRALLGDQSIDSLMNHYQKQSRGTRIRQRSSTLDLNGQSGSSVGSNDFLGGTGVPDAPNDGVLIASGAAELPPQDETRGGRGKLTRKKTRFGEDIFEYGTGPYRQGPPTRAKNASSRSQAKSNLALCEPGRLKRSAMVAGVGVGSKACVSINSAMNGDDNHDNEENENEEDEDNIIIDMRGLRL